MGVDRLVWNETINNFASLLSTPDLIPNSPHILIIEDDSLTAWHLSTMLRDWKYSVTSWSIKQLLSVEIVHYPRPDLILLMENLSCNRTGKNEGLLTVILLGWKIPTIIISAITPSERWLDQPGISYLSKPFGADQLRERIAKVLGP